jgi:hypothetical protein
MARIGYGETFEANTLVTDRDTGNLADAADLTFQYKYGASGTITSVVPTRNSIGNYSVSITTTQVGPLHFRWDTEGSYDVADEQTITVRRSPFYESSNSDYN